MNWVDLSSEQKPVAVPVPLQLDVDRIDQMSVDLVPQLIVPFGTHAIRFDRVRVTNRSSTNAVSLEISLCIQSEEHEELCIWASNLGRTARSILSLWDGKPVQERARIIGELPSWITNAIEEPINIGPQQSKTLDLAFLWHDSLFGVDFGDHSTCWVAWSTSDRELEMFDYVSGVRSRFAIVI